MTEPVSTNKVVISHENQHLRLTSVLHTHIHQYTHKHTRMHVPIHTRIMTMKQSHKKNLLEETKDLLSRVLASFWALIYNIGEGRQGKKERAVKTG